MTDVYSGVVLALIAGVVNGSFATPSKYAKRWRWENIWAIWAVVALFLVPWFLAFGTIPGIVSFYRNTSAGFLVMFAAFGLGVGLSQIFFGLALAAVGLSIGFAVTIGLSTAIGSLVPLILLHAVFTRKGLMVVAGVGLMIAGTGICGVAGHHKERQLVSLDGSQRQSVGGGKSFGWGLLLCILAGGLSPLLNIALAFGAPLLTRAAQLGVSPANQANVIWPPLLTATLIPYLAYCSYLWRRNNSLRLFLLSGTAGYWLFGAIMGLLWMGSLAIYGAASTRMAAMGPALGWPLFMSVIIVTSNTWGIMTGEWKAASRGAVTTMAVGIVFLILGFVTIASGSRLG